MKNGIKTTILSMFLSVGTLYLPLHIVAQTIYSGNTVKVGAVIDGTPTYLLGERTENFKIIVNEQTKTINIQSGDEKESWITIIYTKKEIDKNGDLLYSGCANYDGINPKIKDPNKCACDFAIVNDRIMLNWNIMVYWYYRKDSTKWGNYK